MLWVSLLEVAVGAALILWKKPNRQVSTRWFTAGVLLIVFGVARIFIW